MLDEAHDRYRRNVVEGRLSPLIRSGAIQARGTATSIRGTELMAADCALIWPRITTAAPATDVVGRRGRRAAAAGPVGVEELAAGLVDRARRCGRRSSRAGPAAGWPAELLGAVAVEVGEGRGHRRHRDAVRDAAAQTRRQPAWARLISLAKYGSTSRFGQLRVAVEGLLDLAEEGAADDAAAPPHEGDAAVVDRPSCSFAWRP